MRQTTPEETILAIHRRYQDGEKLLDLCREYRISYSAANDGFKRIGATRGANGRWERRETDAPATEADFARARALVRAERGSDPLRDAYLLAGGAWMTACDTGPTEGVRRQGRFKRR